MVRRGVDVSRLLLAPPAVVTSASIPRLSAMSVLGTAPPDSILLIHPSVDRFCRDCLAEMARSSSPTVWRAAVFRCYLQMRRRLPDLQHHNEEVRGYQELPPPVMC